MSSRGDGRGGKWIIVSFQGEQRYRLCIGFRYLLFSKVSRCTNDDDT
jgi:hypothetical protein